MKLFKFIKNLFKGKEEVKHTGIIGPDAADNRDFKYEPVKSEVKSAATSLLREFSLKPLSCPILNQKETSSCTGHSAAAACNVLLSKICGDSKNYKINPYYIYYYARFMDNMQMTDSGAYMRSLMKALKEYGFCACDLTKPSEKPSKNLLEETFKIKDYRRINNSIEDVQYAIQVDRLPIIISFKVKWSLINQRTGIIDYDIGDIAFSTDGYHAVAVLGWKYINNSLYFIVQNSWGESSGDHGIYYLDSRYIVDKTAVPDIWCFSADYNF